MTFAEPPRQVVYGVKEITIHDLLLTVIFVSNPAGSPMSRLGLSANRAASRNSVVMGDEQPLERHFRLYPLANTT